MTVGIATLCASKTMVFCASDRMITQNENMEHEPQVLKLFHLTNSTVLMIAGDTQIHNLAYQRLMARIKIHPEDYLTVEQCTKGYSSELKGAIRTSIEGAVLGAYCLDFDQFLVRQQSMSKPMFEMLTDRLDAAYATADVDAIVAGIDNDFGHIFHVTSQGYRCCDHVGFAAIGIGATHAVSQLLFSEFSPHLDAQYAMILTYTAKKRSEVAPGVGSTTDMVMMGPQPQYYWFNENTIASLHKIYENEDRRIRAARKKAGAECDAFVQEMVKRADERTSAEADRTP